MRNDIPKNKSFNNIICYRKCIERDKVFLSRSQSPRGLRRRSTAAHLLRLWVRIPPGAWMSVCCECCVLSGRGLRDALITRPEESYRQWCVFVCDLETSRMRRPWLALGHSATGKKVFLNIWTVSFRSIQFMKKKSHWNKNEKLKEKSGSCTRKTFDRSTTKYSYTWNITYNKERSAVWSLKPERWESPLVQEKYQEEKPVTRDINNNNNNNNNNYRVTMDCKLRIVQFC